VTSEARARWPRRGGVRLPEKMRQQLSDERLISITYLVY
jgi:hypothetical protein